MRNVVWLMLLIIVLGGFLRLYHLGYRSLWKDEAYQYYAATKDLQDIRDLGHPLLSHYIVHFFLTLDRSEIMLRLPSVVFGIGSIIMMYLIAKTLFDKRVGLLSSFLVSISPFLIYYSQEGRMYAQFVFLALLSIYFMILSVREEKLVHYSGYIFFTALCLQTHFFAAFVVLAENIYIIAAILFKMKKLAYWKWLITQFFVLLLFTPVFPMLLETGQGHPISVGTNPLTIALSTFYIFSFGRLLFPIGWNITTVLVGAMLYISLFILGVNNIFKKRNRISVLLGSIALTYLIILLANLKFSFMSYYHLRYLIFLAPFFYLLVSRGLLTIKSPIVRKVLVVGIIVVNAFALYPYYFQWSTHGKNDFRSAGKFLSTQMNEGKKTLVVFSDKYSQDRGTLPIEYYMNKSYDYEVIGDSSIDTDNQYTVAAILLVSLSEKTTFEVIKSQNVFKGELGVDSKIVKQLQDHGYVLEKTASWPGKNRIEVKVFKKIPNI